MLVSETPAIDCAISQLRIVCNLIDVQPTDTFAGLKVSRRGYSLLAKGITYDLGIKVKIVAIKKLTTVQDLIDLLDKELK